MKRSVRLPLGVTFVVVVSMAGMIPAIATPSCSYNSGNKKVSVSLPAANDSGTLSIGPGGVIRLNGTACGAATRFNTDDVQVTGGNGHQEFVISMTTGPFAPGFTNEGSGTSEIEFDIMLGNGYNVLQIIGTNNPDRIWAGDLGVNLNASENPDDVDVFLSAGSPLGLLTMAGLQSNDHLIADGGQGTGNEFPVRVTLNGAEANDTLVGGLGDDFIVGFAGADFIDGWIGADTLNGGLGADIISGGADADTISGGPGGDTIHGRGGDDVIDGDNDNDLIFGEGGVDTMHGNSGDDDLRSVDGVADNVYGDTDPNDDSCQRDVGIDNVFTCEILT